MIKKEIGEKSLKERLVEKSKDRLYNFLLADGTVRGAILHGTLMINEMRANHELGILETLVLGHAYLACCLMSANLKGNDRISLKIDCSGPIKGLITEANAFGEVRGYLKQKPIPIEKPLENFNLSPFFGAGFLSIIKYLEDAKQPFTGQVVLKYGSIAKDLANYFFTSEQIPTAFNLSIQFDTEGRVTGAGGLFLQAMPDASYETAAGLEQLVANLPSIGAVFTENINPEEWVQEVFKGYSPRFLTNHRVEFFCHCTPKMIRSFMATMPADELKDMLQKDIFPIETHCQNCNTAYYFSKADIQQLLEERHAKH